MNRIVFILILSLLIIAFIKTAYAANYILSGKLTDSLNSPLQAKISAGSYSTSTNSYGNYLLTIPQGTYNINYSLSNLWISLPSFNLDSNKLNLVNFIYQSSKKVSFNLNLTQDQTVQIPSLDKPIKVQINGTPISEVSSLSSLVTNTWFYDSAGKKLYVRAIVSAKDCNNQCQLRGYSSGTCRSGSSYGNEGVGILHADGITIKNSLNQVVKPRGIHSDWNVAGDINQGHPPEHPGDPPYWTEGDVLRIKSYGGEVIDISVIPYSALLPSPGVIDYENLAAIDNTLAWCKKYQINCIVEMANVNFAYSDWAVPDWMKHGQTDGSQFELDFFDQTNHVYDDTRQDVVDFFVFLTNRYKDNDYFLLDPFNEPFNGNSAIYPGAGRTESDQAGANYARFIERVDDAVVAAGYRNILVVDHPYCPWDMVTRVNRNNIVWDVHAYYNPPGPNGRCDWGFCGMSGWLELMNNYQGLYADTFGQPLWAGEYGMYDVYNQPDYQPVSHFVQDWQNAITQEIDFLDHSEYSGRIFLSYGNIEGEWYDTWAEMNGGDNFNAEESEWLLNTLLGHPSGSSTSSTCQSGETPITDSCSSGTCCCSGTTPSSKNLGVVPDNWGGYETYGDVVYMPSSCYPDCPQITHVDNSVLHNGHVSIRIDHHVDGVDPNYAREVDLDWLAANPGDHIVFKCWIKTSPQAAGYANDLGYPWGSGGRIGIDFYDDNRIGAIQSNPNGIAPVITGANWETVQAVRANYVLWGGDWSQRTIDFIIPQYVGSDGYAYPNGEMHTPYGIIPWLQAWGNEPETGVAWFADCELYINP